MIFKKKKIKTYKDLKLLATAEENFINLVYISNLLKNLEHFVFFGTLLGLVRDNSLIEKDDDIDIYVNINERAKLIKILQDNSILVDFNLSVNKHDSFLQVVRKINNKNAIIDFYFFEDDFEKNYLIEKWNWCALPNDSSKHLRIPKIFTHPIQTLEVKSYKINFPSQPEYLCEFLYGKSWRKKLSEGNDYIIKIIDGKPVMFSFKKNIFGKKKIIL